MRFGSLSKNRLFIDLDILQEYADALVQIFTKPKLTKAMQANGRASVDRFSDESFAIEIIEALRQIPSLANVIRATPRNLSSSSEEVNEGVLQRKRRISKPTL
jgi:hypothetical protein